MITAVTIGLSFATQAVASLFGIELPEQTNVDLVRQWGLNAFKSWRNFGVFAGLVGQVIVLLPVVEELLFRGLLFRLPHRLWDRRRAAPPVCTVLGVGATRSTFVFAVVSSALFSAAHYLQQPFPDNAFLALFFFGLAQCWLYRRTDRLWCAMLNHALFNLTNLVLLFVIPA